MRENIGRSILIAVVVGSALIFINHGDHLSLEPICSSFWLKCGLTFVVPFLVSMTTVALSVRAARNGG